MKIATVCCSKPGAMQTEPALAVCTTAAAKPTTRRLLHPKQTAALPTPAKPCTSQLEAVPLSTTQYCPHLRVVLQQLVGQHQRDHGLNHGHGARHHAGVVPPPRQQLNVLALQQGRDCGGRQFSRCAAGIECVLSSFNLGMCCRKTGMLFCSRRSSTGHASRT